MNLTIRTDDPLNVLASTKQVLEEARFVRLEATRIDDVSETMKKKITPAFLEECYDAMGPSGELEEDLQLVFLQNVVNFCFWPDPGKPKWRVEWPVGLTVTGGWFGLKACFDRARAEGVSILEASYLVDITIEDVEAFFRGVDGTAIPLLVERMKVLQEAGRGLLREFEGQFFNVIKRSNHDAIELVRLMCEHFPAFRDTRDLDGNEIIFLKRAQICANDIGHLLAGEGRTQLRNLEHLTAFADYKIPQMLRHFGILRYSEDLSERVDRLVLLPRGCREEVEIRAATIWGVELIRRKLETFTAAQIDNALWFLSQDQTGVKPYHRTRTIDY
jgi:hypothetical protein